MTLAAEQALLDTARRQRGVVTQGQAIQAGLSPSAVSRRVRAGRFQAIYHGIYRMGPVVDPLSPYVAAVLAGGVGARISHSSAAELRGWLGDTGAAGPARPIHVTVEGSHRGRRSGILLHRVRRLDDDERAQLHGIPVTGPGRTLIDAASGLGLRTVEQMVAAAMRRGLLDDDGLPALTSRYRGRPGVTAISEVAGRRAEPVLTRSTAESRFLALVRVADLPPPRCNVDVGPYEVDFLWEREGLVVEIDGYRFHRSRARFEADRRKDAWLEARGLGVVRLTWRQLTEEAVRTAVLVGRALTHRTPR